MWDCAHETGNPVFDGVEEVEAAAEWEGEPGAFVAALARKSASGKAGWLDLLPDGRFELHHYWDHAPEYVKKRAVRESERRVKGETFHSSITNGSRTAAERQPNGGQSADERQTMAAERRATPAERQPSHLPSPTPSPYSPSLPPTPLPPPPERRGRARGNGGFSKPTYSADFPDTLDEQSGEALERLKSAFEGPSGYPPGHLGGLGGQLASALFGAWKLGWIRPDGTTQPEGGKSMTCSEVLASLDHWKTWWEESGREIPDATNWIGRGRFLEHAPKHKPRRSEESRVNGMTIIPVKIEPPSIRMVQREASDLYREQFKAGHIDRQALDAYLIKVNSIEDRQELYAIIDSVKARPTPPEQMGKEASH